MLPSQKDTGFFVDDLETDSFQVNPARPGLERPPGKGKRRKASGDDELMGHPKKKIGRPKIPPHQHSKPRTLRPGPGPPSPPLPQTISHRSTDANAASGSSPMQPCPDLVVNESFPCVAHNAPSIKSRHHLGVTSLPNANLSGTDSDHPGVRQKAWEGPGRSLSSDFIQISSDAKTDIIYVTRYGDQRYPDAIITNKHCKETFMWRVTAMGLGVDIVDLAPEDIQFLRTPRGYREPTSVAAFPCRLPTIWNRSLAYNTFPVRAFLLEDADPAEKCSIMFGESLVDEIAAFSLANFGSATNIPVTHSTGTPTSQQDFYPHSFTNMNVPLMNQQFVGQRDPLPYVPPMDHHDTDHHSLTSLFPPDDGPRGFHPNHDDEAPHNTNDADFNFPH